MKILNYGSLNIDYVYRLDHLVRPGETISSQALTIHCGGKGLNQSVAVARAGGKPFHAGKTGKDGLFLREKLRESGVDTSLISDHDGASGHAVIQVDAAGQNGILLYQGANGAVTKEEVRRVLNHFEAGDLILLQNEINALDDILKLAYEKGMQIALNPSPISACLPVGLLPLVKYLILNEIEGSALTGETDPYRIADALLQKYPEAAVVLTVGRDGVLYRDAGQSLAHGVYEVPVVDTTAAGDTFTGYFLALTAEGLPVPEILRLASVASSLAVSKQGAADSIPLRAETESAKLEPMTTKR